jgi:hypothetical protein
MTEFGFRSSDHFLWSSRFFESLSCSLAFSCSFLFLLFLWYQMAQAWKDIDMTRVNTQLSLATAKSQRLDVFERITLKYNSTPSRSRTPKKNDRRRLALFSRSTKHSIGRIVWVAICKTWNFSEGMKKITKGTQRPGLADRNAPV